MAAAEQSTPLRWRLRRFLGAASSRFSQTTAAAAGSTWVPRMHRAERAAPPVGEEESVGKGTRGRRMNVCACERGLVRPVGG